MRYAQVRFKLDQRMPDGTVTWREYYQLLARDAGVVEPELQREIDSELPPDSEYLWWWFQDLSNGRSHNGFSFLPITWSDIKAWRELSGTDPEPWEVAVLKRLDAEFLSASLQTRKSEKIKVKE